MESIRVSYKWTRVILNTIGEMRFRPTFSDMDGVENDDKAKRG